MTSQTDDAAVDESKDWFSDYSVDEEVDDQQIHEYELTATPNDFNILTIVNFIESGALKIPGFQRNYVWNIGRASRLIESLILGLPVPQIFLFEQKRNEFLVIDGQQRLMSIYYFIKQRFPRLEKRAVVRQIFDKEGHIPDNVLHNNEYFTDFSLSLPESLPNYKNKFRGLNYSTLSEYKTQFDLRPMRNVIIKQNSESEDDSAIYEIFSRLNSGGVNLTPQEIRTSLYHSDFYTMLNEINRNEEWRRLVGKIDTDLHMKDLEILLRSFAMLIESKTYAPSLVKFLNKFSKKSKGHDDGKNGYLKSLFISFLESTKGLADDTFLMHNSKRFNIALFEATFVAVCTPPFSKRSLVEGQICLESIARLSNDPEFSEATQVRTTHTANVNTRLRRASDVIRINN